MEPVGPVVEGWVLDERIQPVPDAEIRLIGHNVTARPDASGHYVLRAPSGVDLVLTVEAPGFVTQARALAGNSGAHHWVNVTLVRVPLDAPFHQVESFQGILRCGAVVTTQEDPSRPHEHQGVRCSQLLNDTANQWTYEVPAGTTGVVLEAFWDAQSEVAQAMVLKAVAPRSGEVFAFTEGTSPIRAHLSSFKLQQEQAAGSSQLQVVLEPGAGTGNHEHGAAGAFLQQTFTVFATAFFNGPVPPAYTVAEP